MPTRSSLQLRGYTSDCLSANAGYFVEPTIFTNVEDHMMIAKEESFGPVMIVSTFENG